MPPDAPNPPRTAWLVLAPVADLLQRERGFSDTEIGWLNAIYSLPNVVLLL